MGCSIRAKRQPKVPSGANVAFGLTRAVVQTYTPMRSAFLCVFMLLASLAMAMAAARPCAMQQQMMSGSSVSMTQVIAAKTASMTGVAIGNADVSVAESQSCAYWLDTAVTFEDRSEMISFFPAHAAIAASSSDRHAAPAMARLGESRKPLLRPPSRAFA